MNSLNSEPRDTRTQARFWRLVLLTVVIQWTITLWLGHESLSWSVGLANQISNFFLLLSPFVFLSALWRLSPPGMYRQLALGVLVCALIAACWFVSQIMYWTQGRNLFIENSGDKHYVFQGGRQIYVLYVDSGALGGSCTILSLEPRGPMLNLVKSRSLPVCSYPAFACLPDGSIKITLAAEPFHKVTYDVDEFLTGVVGN